MAKVFSFDSETLRNIERMYMAPEVVAQRRVVVETLAPHSGESILDIGCGPGFLADEIAGAVGATGSVCGMDVSESAVELARTRCAGHANARFQTGEATALPFEDSAFDAAAVTQVYEFVADVDRGLAELHRVLRPGGRAAILDTDWWTVLWHSSDPARMARMLRAWDEHLHHPVLPRTLGARLRQRGFSVRDRKAIPYLTHEFRDGSYSYGLAKMIRSFASGRQGITQAEADAWYADLRALADAGEYFFCLNRYLFLAGK